MDLREINDRVGLMGYSWSSSSFVTLTSKYFLCFTAIQPVLICFKAFVCTLLLLMFNSTIKMSYLHCCSLSWQWKFCLQQAGYWTGTGNCTVMNSSLTCGVGVIDSDRGVCRHNVCLQCETGLCRQLLLQLRGVLLLLQPIDGDAALPTVERPCHDLTVLGLWGDQSSQNKETAVIRSCRCPASVIKVCFVCLASLWSCLSDVHIRRLCFLLYEQNLIRQSNSDCVECPIMVWKV